MQLVLYSKYLVDVGRNVQVAEKFRLKVSSMSQQLPTIALMNDGECVEIRPEVTSNGKLKKFHFSAGTVCLLEQLQDQFVKDFFKPIKFENGRKTLIKLDSFLLSSSRYVQLLLQGGEE